MRDGYLEDNTIENLEHARMLVAQWPQRYNDFHPHSSLGYLSPRNSGTMEMKTQSAPANWTEFLSHPTDLPSKPTSSPPRVGAAAKAIDR